MNVIHVHRQSVEVVCGLSPFKIHVVQCPATKIGETSRHPPVWICASDVITDCPCKLRLNEWSTDTISVSGISQCLSCEHPAIPGNHNTLGFCSSIQTEYASFVEITKCVSIYYWVSTYRCSHITYTRNPTLHVSLGNSTDHVVYIVSRIREYKTRCNRLLLHKVVGSTKKCSVVVLTSNHSCHRTYVFCSLWCNSAGVIKLQINFSRIYSKSSQPFVVYPYKLINKICTINLITRNFVFVLFDCSFRKLLNPCSQSQFIFFIVLGNVLLQTITGMYSLLHSSLVKDSSDFRSYSDCFTFQGFIRPARNRPRSKYHWQNLLEGNTCFNEIFCRKLQPV